MSALPIEPTETEVGAVVEALATCLCAQILADGTPKTCFCGVIPGAAIPMDMVTGTCKDADGMAFVRLVNTYPANQVGVQNLEPGNCAVGQGVDLEVGIIRCFPLTRSGGSPKPDVLLARTKLQIADERTMRRAINCCEWLDAQDFVVGLYTPIGPEGGVLGGTIPISAWLP